MTIDKITKLKNNRYKLNIEGEVVITCDDVILNNGLLFKKSINKELYKKIKQETIYYDSYNSALKYAMKKIRCISEMKEYLNKLAISSDDKKKILNKLVNLRIVNDEIYVRSYINDKLLLSNDGRFKIKQHLIDRGIDIEMIEDELLKIDEEEFNRKLDKLIRKKINSNHKYSNIQLKQKIINNMINLGYDKYKIREIIDLYIGDDYPILLKEYVKQYNKLSKKYQGQELIYKLKQSLYKKGFQYDSIKKEDLI